jgi:ankyrin repeat protein
MLDNDYNDHHVFILSMNAREGNLREMEKNVQVFGLGTGIFNHKNSGKAIIHAAAEGGHVEIMAWLKARGANIRLKSDGIVDEGSEPIHLAAINGKLEAVKWLVGQGADINAKGSFGCTPVHFAVGVYRGDESKTHYTVRLAMIKWLKERGADINAKDDLGYTPMYCAIKSGQLEIAEWLKNNGANIQATDSDGGTLMHTAAEYGKVKTMEWLKQEGLDVNAKNNKGKTPLDMTLSEYGKPYREDKDKEEVIEWLKQQIAASVAKVENRQNTGTVMQSISYNDYLKELGHTTENVTVEIEPLKNEIKSLQDKLERQKQENQKLSEDIKKQSDENTRLKKELSMEKC